MFRNPTHRAVSFRLSHAPGARRLWREAGDLLRQRPDLAEAARRARGFRSGARWMREAMLAAGWRLPPFSNGRDHARHGVMKYALCLVGAAGALLTVLFVAGARVGFPVGILAGALAFYAVEAQSVFLFPEALRGSRSPWSSARALTVAAGGTVRVMLTVVPIAARMLTGWARREGLVGGWVRGCIAVVLWHRHVARARVLHTEDEDALPLLEIGPVHPLLLRRERVAANLRAGFRVFWISDLHWRGVSDTACLFALLALARSRCPDIFVLGGDFLEADAALPLFRRLVKSLSGIAPCLALPGNHDRRRLATLRDATLSCGGVWLPDVDTFPLVNDEGERLLIRGGLAPTAGSVSDGPVPDARLTCVHDPAEYCFGGSADEPSPHVVLAGHLHGGQWVWQRRDDGRLIPAAWFYPHAWLRKISANATVLVSRGLGDTFPVRWRCPREVILCELR